jgi:hypothetical protein
MVIPDMGGVIASGANQRPGAGRVSSTRSYPTGYNSAGDWGGRYLAALSKIEHPRLPNWGNLES